MAGYRLLSFRSETGPRAGIALGDAVYDLAAATGRADYATVKGVLEDWTAAAPILAGFAASPRGDTRRLETLELLAPILYPSAIYCAGANYRDHVEKMCRARGLPMEPDPHELGLDPWHFLKVPRAAVGTGAAVALDAENLDWEAELAVVIGRTARNVQLAEALDYVAAYANANDLSARDRSTRGKVDALSPFKYDWIAHKNFDGACPLGPWLVPASEIADPQNLAIKLWVNDTLRQDSSTANMIFTIAEQIAHLSKRITLHPGDVILTGTPAGTGAEIHEFLKRGDVVRIEIEGLGPLTTRIV